MKRVATALAIAGLAAGAAAWRAPQRITASATSAAVADTIIALERSALDRWGRGDPQGYIETFAPEITYFDPFTERRIDGIDGMKAMLKPFVGKIKIDSYEMLNPRVQRSGDVAVLSFNLTSHVRNPDGSPRTVRWNSTEVYRRIAGKWKIVHNHWSFTKPELRQPASP
jgi:ketosteroid isomerase-like protein